MSFSSACLTRLVHGILYRQTLVQDDAVRGHPAADLVLVKGCDEPYLLLDILVQGIQDQFPFLPADGVQDLHCIIRFHLGDDLARLSGADLFQAFPCLFLLQMGERLCQHLRRTDAEHLFRSCSLSCSITSAMSLP